MRKCKSDSHLTRSLAGNAWRDRKGSAAVEFALVAPPFLALMMSTFEVGWFYFATSQIDAAAIEAARTIRTGQVQQANGGAGLTKEEFYAQVCPSIAPLGDCSALLTVEVDTFGSFAELASDTSAVVCTNDDPAEIAALSFAPGDENQIVRLRLCLLYKTLNPTIGVNVSQTAEGKRRVFATYVVRNEPFRRNVRTVS